MSLLKKNAADVRTTEAYVDAAELTFAAQELASHTRATLAELANMLDGKKVIGEPIRAGETTVIPMLDLGFGFGVVTGQGGGRGNGQTGTGFGGAIGGGGGVKPVAMLVIDKDGVRMLRAPDGRAVEADAVPTDRDSNTRAGVR